MVAPWAALEASRPARSTQTHSIMALILILTLDVRPVREVVYDDAAQYVKVIHSFIYKLFQP